ncbi:MAG: prephenate dehydrogenase/arogenate dehydrogenase family protein [Mycobacterium sp.]|nr:MAG: prephenate dehydrogenase/arogenate dehydrogenase family protein [Mycobacterium sp.]
MTTSGATAEPTTLVVVGAAAGMGRWLVDHLLLSRPWDRAVLADADIAALRLSSSTLDNGTTPIVMTHPGEASANLSHPGTAVLIAVPRDAVGGVLDWLVPLLAHDAVIGVVTANQSAGIDALARRWPSSQVFGLHPLFDVSARSAEGQTLLVVGLNRPPATPWLTDLIAEAGAISDSGSATDHDAIMRYVQTLTHQTLVSFADAVTSSGLDLQNVWEARTPVFEGLFGLSTRVLAEHQQATVADIQLSTGGTEAADELTAAVARWQQTVASGSQARVERELSSIRDRFSGALFDTVQATAVSAVAAAQSKRADLSRHRRLGSLVGIRPVARPAALRVGTIVDVTPVSVTLRELMVGKQGSATLLEGPGQRNAAKVGMNGTPSDTTFGLGHVDVVTGTELSEALDEWLAFIRRDVRFLVPESVAGAGVLTIVAAHPGVRGADVVSEVVRTGQRAVNIRVHVRADHDVDDTVEELRNRVQRTYRWPTGLSLAAPDTTRVHFLGPAGTFSETAARQAATSIDAGTSASIELVAHESFGAVLGGIAGSALGVVPISSSASGLVTRAVSALLTHPGPLASGGVVDVAVRIDAYIGADLQLSDLRGARVLSHPQALGQCQAFIRRWQLEAVPCSSTTEALRVVAANPDGAVALAGADSPIGQSLKVAEREVDDLSGSITRFLILGDAGAFGDLGGGWDPTLRSLWVADSLTAVLPMLRAGAPAFDELLTDSDGGCLWVTSRIADPAVVASLPAGVRHLGRAPWSPRTPVVRVEVDIPG